MRYTKLANVDAAPSVLGFGCAPMLGRIGRRAARRALDVAFDHGVNYFDIARSYGYGDAERLLGEFIRAKRDQILVTTKFGIQPPKRSPLLSAAKPIARGLIGLFPTLRARVRRGALGMTSSGQFGVGNAKLSLERSLQELGTDHVDCLLLHACTPVDLVSDELFEFLDTCVDEGKVRTYGVSTEKSFLEPILELRGGQIRVLQYPHSVFDRESGLVPESDAAHSYVSHSAFGGGVALGKLKDMLSSGDPEFLALADGLGLEFDGTRALTQLVLAYALQSTEPGIVVCSMYDPNHIRENVRIASDMPFSPEVVNAFRAAVRRVSPVGD